MWLLINVFFSSIVIGIVSFLLAILLVATIPRNVWNEKPKEWEKVYQKLIAGVRISLTVMVITGMTTALVWVWK